MKRICLLLLLLQSLLLHAQQFNVATSSSFKQKGDFSDRFFRFNDTYLRYSIEAGPMQLAYSATLKKVRYGINLYTYNSGMKEIKKLSLDEGDRRFGPFKPTAFVYNGKLNVLYYRYVEDADVIKLYLAQIDPADLAIDKTVELFTIDQNNLWILKAETAIAKNNVFVKFSSDSSKMLITSCNDQFIYSCVADKQLNISQNTVIKSKIAEGITIADACIDNSGNKYYSYNHMPDKEYKRGLITQGYKGGQAKFQEFKTMQDEYEANDLYFGKSKDGSKVYVYANYYGDFLNEGVLLTTIDTSFKIEKPQLFPYPGDFKQRLEEEDFAEKQKGNLSVRRTDYTFFELNDGVIALIGCPKYSATAQSTVTNTITTSTFVGPITGIFIHPGKAPVYTMLPRKTFGSATSRFISGVYDNKVLLLYCDEEKNLSADLTKRSNYTKHEVDMVLAAAMFDENGNVIKRQKISNVPGDDNYYFLSDAEKFNTASFLIPIGRDRVNMAKYYQQVEQMVTVEIR